MQMAANGAAGHAHLANDLAGANLRARFDADLALSVAQYDKQVDREYKSALRELVTYMMEDPRSIGRVLSVIWVLRSLERIGDHARNIAQLVIYLVRGTDVRHMGLKRMEQEVKGDEAQ